jgi:hypothetical protein
MAINLQPSDITIDQKRGVVKFTMSPYDSETQEFANAFGAGKKVEVPLGQLSSSLKEALVTFAVEKQNVTPDDPEAQPTPDQLVTAKISQMRKAVVFIQDEFIKENILLGIEQRGLTEQVLNIAAPVMAALQGLALKVAVMRLKEINPSGFDGVILNEERLLKFRNKIEAAFGAPLATSWNQGPTWE